jgi:hypothetical protein
MKKHSLLLTILVLCISSCADNKKEKSEPQINASVTTKAEVEKPKQYSAILSKDNIPSEFFKVYANKGITITGKHGTKIHIPKNAFEDEDGNAVNGEIAFELKEIYSAGDMLLGNFTTMSGGKVLQTGGMLYINAVSGSKKLRLKKGRTIELLMPANKAMTGMTVFKGTQDVVNGSIEWMDTAEKISLMNEPTGESISSEAMPSVAGSWEYSMKDNDRIPGHSAVDVVFNDSIIYLMELAQFGKVTLVTKERKKFPNEAGWFHSVERSPVRGEYFVALHSNDSLVEEKTVVFVPFFRTGEEKAKYEAAYGEAVKREAAYAAEVEKREKEYMKRMEKTDYVKYYSLKTNILGLINCDRFLDEKGTIEAEFAVAEPANGDFNDIKINLLLKKYNSCLPLSEYIKTGNSSSPIHLPTGAEAIAVATAYKNDKIYLSISRFKITKNNSVPLQFKETSIKEIKKELNQI